MENLNNRVTTKEAAQILGVSDGRVRQMILKGQLSAKRFGRALTLSRRDVELLRGRKVGRPKKGRSAVRAGGSKLRKSHSKSLDEIIAEKGRLTEEEVLHPERYPYLLLSMTVPGRGSEDAPYWNRLTGLLRKQVIDDIHRNPEVRRRSDRVIGENRVYADLLKRYTRVVDQVAVTDFRPLAKAPQGSIA